MNYKELYSMAQEKGYLAVLREQQGNLLCAFCQANGAVPMKWFLDNTCHKFGLKDYRVYSLANRLKNIDF